MTTILATDGYRDVLKYLYIYEEHDRAERKLPSSLPSPPRHMDVEHLWRLIAKTISTNAVRDGDCHFVKRRGEG